MGGKYKFVWFENECELNKLVNWSITSQSLNFLVVYKYNDDYVVARFVDDPYGFCFMIHIIADYFYKFKKTELFISKYENHPIYIDDIKINFYNHQNVFQYVNETFRNIWYEKYNKGFFEHVYLREKFLKKHEHIIPFDLIKKYLSVMQEVNNYSYNLIN